MTAEFRTRLLAKPLKITLTVLATAVAAISFRYLAGVGPVPPSIATNVLRRPWLLVHVASASTALLIGSIQFSGVIRSRWLETHRGIGRLYVLSCLFGGISGIVLAFGSSSGPIATAGFGLLGVAWISVTAQGLRYALLRRFDDHRAWMIRSWALTLSAVTLRVYVPIATLIGLPFFESYRVISFLSWVPNLLLAELYLREFSLSARPVGKGAQDTHG
ncbi:DUF2306 domain-containing protein [Sphingomonas ginsenosidivorax]|uniref:DUF2306 domain-containing protein n=1 Tax=Sphingomonas ginsenosidivorax TaxID=862135 RepID=A0A5C6U5W8_9SPHN|nr:DUF2306 domain-containing protein [Sphingomonas ginsenosidivorax]TXC67990.1 DUF2306 domain-containing protein [Sphingomonas ginsenosidivorax]